MLTRHLDYDAVKGLETLFHYDEQTDTTYIEYKQDVQGALDACKALHSERIRNGGKLQDWEHYAHIPDVVALKWYAEKGIKVWDKSDQKKVFALLNDPEYRHLKIANFIHRPK
jgi:hypothetical protein